PSSFNYQLNSLKFFYNENSTSPTSHWNYIFIKDTCPNSSGIIRNDKVQISTGKYRNNPVEMPLRYHRDKLPIGIPLTLQNIPVGFHWIFFPHWDSSESQWYPTGIPILNKHKVKLQKNYMMFVHGVDSKTDIADHLYQSDVLSTEEKEEICNSSLTQQESNRLLYNKLIRKGGDAYTHLLEAVRHGEYPDVASEMEKTELSDQEIQLCQIGMKKVKDRQEKKDILMDHDEVIPKHILEQFEKRLEQWKKDDQQFVSTEAEKHVMQKVLTQSSVTLVGNSGTGKSFLSKHIALIMKKHGYTVIPCSKPKDIGKWFKHGRKTLFVFDDVCGRYTLNQQIYTDWKQRLDHIISLLEDKCCKIISTCRLEVYKDELFSNLSIFKMCNIDLSSQEFKLSAAEKFALAEVYFKENTDEVKELSEKYDFFPLLCSLYHKQNLQKNVSVTSFFSNPFEVFKDQLVQMYGESDAGKMQYCSLVLCVMFNNTLTEENLSPKDKKIGASHRRFTRRM
ncbi:Hypothetical predicted protein, partial [Mytilus galloprovincialis]